MPLPGAPTEHLPVGWTPGPGSPGAPPGPPPAPGPGPGHRGGGDTRVVRPGTGGFRQPPPRPDSARLTPAPLAPAPFNPASGSGSDRLPASSSSSGRAARTSASFRAAIGSGSQRVEALSPELESELEAASADPRRRIGERYLLLKPLGSGGVGVVWLAIDQVLGRKVALKRLMGGGHSPTTLQRFVNEARTSAALHHPGIAGVYDVGEHEGAPYIAMEFIDGQSMAAVIEEGIKAREAARIVRDVANAIEHAHGAGAMHRDLKPHNVLVEPGGRAVVVDFGLARPVESKGDVGITIEGAVVGTPAYMAPEQATGRSENIGPWSDVYGLGAILYEALTGEPPYNGPNPTVVLAALLMRDPRAPHTISPKVPRDLETICLKAMERSPQHRYESAGALASDLGRWLDDEPILARPPGLGRRISRATRRHKAVLIAATLVALIGLAVLGAQYRRRLQDEELAANAAAAREADERRRADELVARARAARKPQKAIALIERALDLDPDNAGALQAKERAEDRLKLEETATRIFGAITPNVTGEERLRSVEAALEAFPDHVPAMVERARVRVGLALVTREKGDLDAARELVAGAIVDAREAAAIEGSGLVPYGALVPVLEDEELSETDEVATILDLLGEAFTDAVEDVESLVVRARLLLAEGDADGAGSVAQEAIERIASASPTRAEAYRVRARALLARGDPEGAVKAARLALDDNKANVAALITLGASYAEIERFADALDAYGRVIEAVPERVTGYLLRANLREERGDYLGAAADLEQVLLLTGDRLLRVRVEDLKEQAKQGLRRLEGVHAMGYYFGPVKVGYSITRYEHIVRDGEPVFVMDTEAIYGQQGTGFNMKLRFEFSEEGDGPIRRLDCSADGLFGARRLVGEVDDAGVLHATLTTHEGTRQVDIEGLEKVDAAGHLAIERLILTGEATEGTRGTAHAFNPTTMTVVGIEYEFVRIEKAMIGGRPGKIYRVLFKVSNSLPQEIAFDDRGRKVYGRTGGMFVELPEDAEHVRDLQTAAVDLSTVEASMELPVEGEVPERGGVTMRVTGVQEFPTDPGPGITITREKLGVFRLEFTEPDFRSALEAPLPAGDGPAPTGADDTPMSEAVIAKAREITAGSKTTAGAVARIVDWTRRKAGGLVNVKKDIEFNPRFLPRTDLTYDDEDIVADVQGLARALSIPTRLVIGLVLNRRDLSFEPHWWLEFGAGDTWVPVDPIFGQLPADPVRIACGRGSLDGMVLLGMTLARFEVVEEEDGK